MDGAERPDRADGPPRDRTNPAAGDALIVDVDGFEGPLDLLLALARRQKVDLARVSIHDLARQYLAFVETAQALRIELAADYLVTAAWLAYLKSRLLLPPDPEEEGPSAEEMARHLAFQLERLEAMRAAAERLMDRPRLGHDVHPRGAPDDDPIRRRLVHRAALIDLLRAYARIRTRDEFRPLALDRVGVVSMEEALDRLRPLLGIVESWTDLVRFLPADWTGAPSLKRSAMAATFAASLELAKRGAVELKQGEAFAPILLRGRT